MSVPTWATYRAECIPHKTGCRQCGRFLKSVHRAYCSGECRDTFERDHFWNRARWQALRAANHKCAKCGARANEVNHIKPLNGDRDSFGCGHHQSNLEALCRKCHKEETRRQWRAGEIGKPKTPRSTPLLDSEVA